MYIPVDIYDEVAAMIASDVPLSKIRSIFPNQLDKDQLSYMRFAYLVHGHKLFFKLKEVEGLQKYSNDYLLHILSRTMPDQIPEILAAAIFLVPRTSLQKMRHKAKLEPYLLEQYSPEPYPPLINHTMVSNGKAVMLINPIGTNLKPSLHNKLLYDHKTYRKLSSGPIVTSLPPALVQEQEQVRSFISLSQRKRTAICLTITSQAKERAAHAKSDPAYDWLFNATAASSTTADASNPVAKHSDPSTSSLVLDKQQPSEQPLTGDQGQSQNQSQECMTTEAEAENLPATHMANEESQNQSQECMTTEAEAENLPATHMANEVGTTKTDMPYATGAAPAQEQASSAQPLAIDHGQSQAHSPECMLAEAERFAQAETSGGAQTAKAIAEETNGRTEDEGEDEVLVYELAGESASDEVDMTLDDDNDYHNDSQTSALPHKEGASDSELAADANQIVQLTTTIKGLADDETLAAMTKGAHASKQEVGPNWPQGAQSHKDEQPDLCLLARVLAQQEQERTLDKAQAAREAQIAPAETSQDSARQTTAVTATASNTAASTVSSLAESQIAACLVAEQQAPASPSGASYGEATNSASSAEHSKAQAMVIDGITYSAEEVDFYRQVFCQWFFDWAAPQDCGNAINCRPTLPPAENTSLKQFQLPNQEQTKTGATWASQNDDEGLLNATAAASTMGQDTTLAAEQSSAPISSQQSSCLAANSAMKEASMDRLASAQTGALDKWSHGLASGASSLADREAKALVSSLGSKASDDNLTSHQQHQLGNKVEPDYEAIARQLTAEVNIKAAQRFALTGSYAEPRLYAPNFDEAKVHVYGLDGKLLQLLLKAQEQNQTEELFEHWPTRVVIVGGAKYDVLHTSDLSHLHVQLVWDRHDEGFTDFCNIRKALAKHR